VGKALGFPEGYAGSSAGYQGFGRRDGMSRSGDQPSSTIKTGSSPGPPSSPRSAGFQTAPHPCGPSCLRGRSFRPSIPGNSGPR